MKNWYQIQEICRLYKIGPDSLRYYEKIGLISPMRSPNNYRLYSLSDIWRLNVIRDLLKLDFSTAEIKAYLDDRTLASTETLLNEKEAILRRRLKELSKDLSDVQKRRQDLFSALSEPMDEIQLHDFPKRRCLRLKDHIENDEDVDFLLTKLSRRLEEQLSIIGNCDTGSVLEWTAEKNVQRTSVFICTEEQSCDFILDAGRYLTVTYRGDRDQHDFYVPRLRQAMTERQLRAAGSILEFLLVDVHETCRTEENITQLQVRVVPETYHDGCE